MTISLPDHLRKRRWRLVCGSTPGRAEALGYLGTCSTFTTSAWVFFTIAPRRASRKDQAIPDIEAVTRHARFGNGRHLGRDLRALRAGDRERLDFAGPHVRQQRRRPASAIWISPLIIAVIAGLLPL